MAPSACDLSRGKQGGKSYIIQRAYPIIVGVTCLIEICTLPQALSRHAREIPFLLCHGTMDSVVHFAHGKASMAQMKALGVQVDFHEYPMAHTASPDELYKVEHFINEVLPPLSGQVAGGKSELVEGDCEVPS